VGHDDSGTVAAVRNALAQEATGDWLCFLDADDQLAPGYVTAMQKAHETVNPVSRHLFTPAVSYVKARSREKAKFWPECSLETGNWLVIGTLVQKDLFLEVGGFEEWAIYEDWALWGRCWKAGAQIVKVPDAIYQAHRGPRSRNHALPRREINRVYQEIRQAVWG
jgi:GT2 family glycosyltransferase